ncbi:hypothetical protein [uncultured Dokdonia sp.]|uniref:hypothetical protein n=1 Tax=uncultured Dokdonia sp. TaxID=575653 RepID=UPI0030EE750E
MKKKLLIFFSLITCFLIIGCSSNRKMNTLISKSDCNKTVHFVWDESSNFTRIQSQGTFKNDYFSLSKGKKLNYRSIFAESLKELGKKTNAKLLLKNSHTFPSDSIIQVTVKIENIVWHKGFSKAIMDTHLVYNISNQVVPILGKSKAQSNARAGKSLLQSFEHGNLLFLLAYCDR